MAEGSEIYGPPPLGVFDTLTYNVFCRFALFLCLVIKRLVGLISANAGLQVLTRKHHRKRSHCEWFCLNLTIVKINQIFHKKIQKKNNRLGCLKNPTSKIATKKHTKIIDNYFLCAMGIFFISIVYIYPVIQ